jgi:hypothetical protein
VTADCTCSHGGTAPQFCEHHERRRDYRAEAASVRTELDRDCSTAAGRRVADDEEYLIAAGTLRALLATSEVAS